MSIHASPPADAAPSEASPKQDAKATPEQDALQPVQTQRVRPKPVSAPLSLHAPAAPEAASSDGLPKKLAKPTKGLDNSGELQLHSNARPSNPNDAASPLVIPAPIPAGAPAN
jgi:hypothetical protein